MNSALVAGERIAERFVLERLLGEGGMGAVWAAQHAVTGKRVALKFLKGTGAEERKRFVQEARVASAIRHPNVTEVHDVLELDGGRPMMVMDLLEGESLADVVERRGSLPVPELMPMALQVLAGLGAAHALGVVHRDMKPDNVFLARSSTGEVSVKVLDFGIAKLTTLSSGIRQTHALTQTGGVLGTPHYMAPEQVFGEKALDHRADFWSLGVMLYECLSGVCPIQGENIGQLFKAISQRTFLPLAERMPKLDRELAKLIDAMMAARPEDRPDSARAIAAVIASRTGLSLPAIAEPRWSPEARRLSVSPLDARPYGDASTTPHASRARARAVLALGAASLAAVGLLVWRVKADSHEALRETKTASTSASADAVARTEPSSTDPVPAAMPPSPSASASTPPVPNTSLGAGGPASPMRTSVVERTSTRASATPESTAAPTEAPKAPARTGGIYEVSPY